MRIAALSLLTLATCSNPVCAAEAKPNIVFILADDLGYGDLGCFGQTKIQTPYLDRMAAEGMRFTNFYAGSTVCAPSRCTLMTGKLGIPQCRPRPGRAVWPLEGGSQQCE
jgi:arylsulfatase A